MVSRTGAENTAPRFCSWRIIRTVLFSVQSIVDFNQLSNLSEDDTALFLSYSEDFLHLGLSRELVCPYLF